METTTQSSNSYLRARIVIPGLLGALFIALLASVAWQASSYVVTLATVEILPLSASSTLFPVKMIILVLGEPLFGLAADLLGRRKLVLAGALLLGIALVVCGLMRNPLLAYADILGMTLGLAMLRPPLLAYLLKAPRSPWALASVAGAYLAVALLGAWIATDLAAPPGGSPWILFPSMSGLLLLIAVAIEGGLIGLAYRRSRSHSWPQWWPEGERSRFWLLSLLAVLALAMTVNMAQFIAFSSPRFALLQYSEIDLKSLNALRAALPVIYAVALLVGGVGADLLDWLSWRFTRRALGRAALLILGILLLCAGMGLSWSAGNWAALRAGLVLVMTGLGLAGAPIIALIAVNVRPRWWGVAFGIYFALTYLSGLLVSSLDQWASARTLGLWFGGLYLLLAIVVVVTTVCGGRPAPVEPSQPRAPEKEEGLNA